MNPMRALAAIPRQACACPLPCALRASEVTAVASADAVSPVVRACGRQATGCSTLGTSVHEALWRDLPNRVGLMYSFSKKGLVVAVAKARPIGSRVSAGLPCILHPRVGDQQRQRAMDRGSGQWTEAAGDKQRQRTVDRGSGQRQQRHKLRVLGRPGKSGCPWGSEGGAAATNQPTNAA